MTISAAAFLVFTITMSLVLVSAGAIQNQWPWWRTTWGAINVLAALIIYPLGSLAIFMAHQLFMLLMLPYDLSNIKTTNPISAPMIIAIIGITITGNIIRFGIFQWLNC